MIESKRMKVNRDQCEIIHLRIAPHKYRMRNICLGNSTIYKNILGITVVCKRNKSTASCDFIKANAVLDCIYGTIVSKSFCPDRISPQILYSVLGNRPRKFQ